MPENPSLVNSIVGPGTLFKGHITVSGLLRIDGDFVGSVQTTGRVIVGRGGRADCTIDADTVVIGGVFRGNVYASTRVIALESALIIGNVFSPRLIAEPGVVLDGGCHVRGAEAHGTDRTSTPPAPTARKRRPRRRSAPLREPELELTHE